MEKKRKLEITSVDNGSVKKEKTINSKVLETMVDIKTEGEDSEQNSLTKRRRKSIRCADSSDEVQVKVEPDSSIKNSTLPQKKRAFQASPTRSPSRKNSKLNTSTVEDDEILIRETEAALKSLSGSYTGPREEDKFEQPQFENLFEEKKTSKITPVNTNSTSSNVDLSNPLKDIITLRELQDIKNQKDSKRNVDNKLNHAKIKKEDGRNGETARYEPDFNELVDDSSNELEIDISESEEKKDEKKDFNSKTFDEKNNNSTLQLSTSSAFRSPELRNRVNLDNAAIPLIGPFPASATFVGYPGMQSAAQNLQVAETKLKEEKSEVDRQEVGGKTPVGSPDSKQYTILQPAGAGSRAATVMEDIVREGVLSVSAVSSSSSTSGVVTSSIPGSERNTPSGPEKVSAGSAEAVRPLGSLSPNSLSRGGKSGLVSTICIQIRIIYVFHAYFPRETDNRRESIPAKGK